MSNYPLIILFFLTSNTLLGQQENVADTVSSYFNEIRIAAAENKNIWGYDLYAPILLVQPDTREVYANLPDTAGVLRRKGAVYAGILPVAINVSNTSIHWGGRDWAMIMLPLPDNKGDRLNLLAHELFHRAQPRLGFTSYNPQNNHLDQKDGRIYLRLELGALKAALAAGPAREMNKHLTDALTFRMYRYQIFRNADTTENLLELNEGLAEYTGAMMSGRNKQEMHAHFLKSVDGFLKNPTFVRSFAYQTIPIYGYLLSRTKPEWNTHITSTTDLVQYFLLELNIHLPDDLKGHIARVGDQYGTRSIVEEENAREERIKKVIAAYRDKFLEQPHLEVPLRNMNISFDFRDIMPFEDKGTVYPTIRVTDDWGILSVTTGALMSPDWNTITVSRPIRFDGKLVSGDGWELELNYGFAVRKDSVSRNYILTKQ